MRSLSEPQFHMLMALLVIGSLFLDQHVTKILPAWNMPAIGLVTFLLGMVWVTLFAAHRFRNLQERITVLEDRLDRMQREMHAIRQLQIEGRSGTKASSRAAKAPLRGDAIPPVSAVLPEKDPL